MDYSSDENFIPINKSLLSVNDNEPNNHIPGYAIVKDDADVIFIQKTSEFALDWLNKNGYRIEYSEPETDYLCCRCERKGIQYTIFFYAYGEEEAMPPDGNYCRKLYDLRISENNTILVIYVKVNRHTDEDGNILYSFYNFNSEDNNIKSWNPITVMGKNILNFFPNKETIELSIRFIAAFNTLNLDIIQAIFDDEICIEYLKSGYYFNSGVFGLLSKLHSEHGNMKSAYISFNDTEYFFVAYLDNYCYFDLNVNEKNKICRITIFPLNDVYNELLISDDYIDNCTVDNVPPIISVKFLTRIKNIRFSMLLKFENGENKRYDLPLEEIESGDEAVFFRNCTFTDKIFTNGRLNKHIKSPDLIGYYNYPERGQGIEFINGFSISTVRLYHDSIPVDKFSIVGFDSKQIFYYNANNANNDDNDDGYAVGHIANFDPINPYYLFDKKTMTAVPFPEEYQKTQVCVYPFCGGYSEGLVMVNLLGEIELQYHHNFMGCAGLWGWIDKEFNIVIPPQYVYAQNFQNGRAIVCKGHWDIAVIDNLKKYWCSDEQWGIIDTIGKEIIPCVFDELYEIDNTERYIFTHKGGWESGFYCIFDVEIQNIIFQLDFDFDMGYMFNECFVTESNLLVFVIHLAGKEQDNIYAYSLTEMKYLVYRSEYTERTFNGKKKIVVQIDGEDIIIF